MATIDRRPLAAQLRDQIWNMLQENQAQPGDRLPSEDELATRFGVSRVTVREALKMMEEERLVLCRHGVGRFVAPGSSDVLQESMTNLKSMSEMAHDLNIPLETKVLSLREEIPDEFIRSRLDLDAGMSVVILERVRLTKGEPVIYSIDIFPRQSYAGALEAEMFEGSLVSVMEGRWNTWLAYSKTAISAVCLPDEICKKIGVPPTSAWILLEQTNYNARNQPVLYSKDYHRGDKFQFHVLRRRR